MTRHTVLQHVCKGKDVNNVHPGVSGPRRPPRPHPPAAHSIHHVYVIDDNDRPCAVVTPTDVLRMFVVGCCNLIILVATKLAY
jgi:hypothetical protein